MSHSSNVSLKTERESLVNELAFCSMQAAPEDRGHRCRLIQSEGAARDQRHRLRHRITGSGSLGIRPIRIVWRRSTVSREPREGRRHDWCNLGPVGDRLLQCRRDSTAMESEAGDAQFRG